MSSNKKTQQKPKAVVKKPVQPKDHVCDFCGQKGTDLRGALYLCKVCAALEDSASSEPEPEAPKPKPKPVQKRVKKPAKLVPDACTNCGETGGKQHGEDFVCDECWVLHYRRDDESESEEPEAFKVPDDACNWCGFAGAKHHGDDFICDPCRATSNSESEPETTEKPKPAQKRKAVYDTKEVERYKKKMKELDLKPVEWKEHDMVKVDADGNFICADPEKAKQFDELFEEQEDFCQDFGTVFMELEPEDADAMNFQFKHTIAKAANIISNHIADTLGLKKTVQ